MKTKLIGLSAFSGILVMLALYGLSKSSGNAYLYGWALVVAPAVLFGLAIITAVKDSKWYRKIIMLILSEVVYFLAYYMCVRIVSYPLVLNSVDSSGFYGFLAASEFGAIAFIMLFHFVLYKIDRFFLSLICGVIISCIAIVPSFLLNPNKDSAWAGLLIFPCWQMGVSGALAVGVKNPSTP